MIKIFVHHDHHELEALVNNWISSNSITILDFSHTMSVVDENLIHSIILVYKFDEDNPC